MRKATGIRAVMLALAMAAVGIAQANDYIFSFGNLALPNTTTTGGGVTVNFSPTSSEILRGFYLQGNWTGTTSSASVVRTGLTNNAGWTTSLAPQTAADRMSGGSTTTAAASSIGTYSIIYSNATAPWNSNGDTMVNGPALAGNWTANVRQNTATADTYNLASANLHMLTDAIAPMAGALSATSPTYQRVNSVTGVGTGTLNAGTTFKYAVNTFVAPATGSFMVGSVTREASGAQYDGWSSLYQGVFDPLNPLTNVVGVDDDSAYGVGTASSMWINLTQGQMYTFVQSTFGTTTTLTASGAYTVYIAGVPEPGSMIALAVGIGVLAARRRRRK